MSDSIDRRNFLKKTAAAGLGLGVASGLSPAYSATGTDHHKIVVAVAGVNSRGNKVAKSFARIDEAEVAYICDVDERAVEKTVANVNEIQGKKPQGITDFRRALDDNDVDALAIATPDHWHVPAALLALDAGKHVYVEKPCSHNPHEGEMLVEAQHQHDLVVQMGNQRRSMPWYQQAVQRIHEGLIGRPYYARAWYARARGPLDLSENPTEIPSWLNYDLWQGPAPRKPYHDNLIHYNWHWRWHWGTGEICNNGIHEVDIARWALEVDFPKRVTSTGGRYHYDDDWQTFDTQVAGWDFDEEKSIAWEGRSSNPGALRKGMRRGLGLYGTEGSLIIDQDGYSVYNLDNEEIEQVSAESTLANPDMDTDDLHTANFAHGIQDNAELNSPINEGYKSTLFCLLGNIAQRTGDALHIDASNGHIQDNEDAQALWSRKYASGWEPKLQRYETPMSSSAGGR